MSNATPLVSIIVPVYNVQPYLRQCMESLVHQTLREIEIVCVDDGSTDGSAEILAEYATEDCRVHVITQKNSSLGAARNMGLKHISSPFVMFCDSDDWYEPNACEIMLALMGKGGGVDMGQCGWVRVDEKGMPTKDFCETIPNDLTDSIKAPCMHSVCNKIFKKEIIEHYDIKFPVRLCCEDAAFAENYLAHSRMVICSETRLYNYRQRRGSILHNTKVRDSQSYIDRLKIAEIIFEHHKAWGKLTERRDRLWLNFYALYEASLVTIPSEKIKRSCFQEAVSFVHRWLPQVSAEEVPPHVSWLLSCLRSGKTPEYAKGIFRKKITWKVKEGELIVNEKWSVCGLTLLRRKSGEECSIYYWAGILPIKGKLIPEYPKNKSCTK